jgi:tetratricopeptide (TPR) repeat protein
MRGEANSERPKPEPDEVRTFAAGRYAVRRVLGEGGQKIVYLVHDAVLDRDCALSLVKESALDLVSIDRMRREARAIARMQGDPRVVQVHDFGEEDGAPYFVSEYVDGGDLRSAMRGYPDGLALDRVLTVASDIAGALAAAHERGVIHRDVTPANVWLTADGRSKLGDFGLACAGEAAFSEASPLVGTAAYMAPEQALGQPSDAKSDLYALGGVMYELATGRQPFVGEDALAVVAQHINSTPVAPRWHNPAIPVPLDSLILSLLAKDPDDRPDSARSVCSALAALDSHDAEVLAPIALNPLERLAAGVFVGREAEVGELRAAVESALRGHRQVVVVAGEAGIGKTRIAEQIATYARIRRVGVHWGQCLDRAGTPAFWPWMQVLRSHAETQDDDELRLDLGEGVGRISQLVPSVGARTETDTTPRPDAEDARFELFEAIADWLRRSARRKPLMLMLDDLHWADESSILLLEHLIENLRDEPILLGCTYRDAEIAAEHPLRRLLDALPRLRGVKQISLRGLSEGAVASYVELAIGQPAPPRLAAAVFRQADGNPLFVSEVVRMLVESGGVKQRDESWTQQIPDGVRGVIGHRLGKLSPSCLGVLTAASVLGREFELRVLERSAGFTVEVVLDAIDEGMSARLIRLAPESQPHQGRYSFSHALVRDVVYDQMSSRQRLKLHLAAANALEDLYGSDPGHRISALAYHFREAGPVGDIEKAIAYSVRAGDAARRLYAYEEALRHWDAAIELLDDVGRPQEQAGLLQRAADLTYLSGVGFERGIEYLSRALTIWERSGDPRQQALAHWRLGRTFTTYVEVTDISRAMRHFEAAIRLQPHEVPTSALAATYAGLASAQDRALLTDQGLASARKARAIATELKSDSLRLTAMQLEGGFLMRQGYETAGVALMDEAWDIADRINDPIVGFYCSWTRGFRQVHYHGNPRGTVALYLRELTKPRMAEAPKQRQTMHEELSVAYHARGDRSAIQGLELEPESLQLHENQFDGRWQEVASTNLESRDHYREVGNRLVEGMRAQSAGIAFSYLGRLDEAVDLFTEAADVYVGADVGAELRARTLLCIAEAERGHAQAASDHLDRCNEIASRPADWLGQMGRIEMARGAVLAARGEFAEALPAFARAVELMRQYDLPWDEADALRLWGRALAGCTDAGGSMEKFRRAIDIYRRIGAGAPWLARIVREYASDSTAADVTIGG